MEKRGLLHFLDIKGTKKAKQSRRGGIDPSMLNLGFIDSSKIKILAINDLEYGTDLLGKSTLVLDCSGAQGGATPANSTSEPKLTWLHVDLPYDLKV